MINMSIYVYFPAPIEYSFSDLRSVYVGGGPDESPGVIHRRFGFLHPTATTPLRYPQRLLRRCLDAVSDVGADDARDVLDPITYRYEYQPTGIHICCIFICPTASHEILMRFTTF